MAVGLTKEQLRGHSRRKKESQEEARREMQHSGKVFEENETEWKDIVKTQVQERNSIDRTGQPQGLFNPKKHENRVPQECSHCRIKLGDKSTEQPSKEIGIREEKKKVGILLPSLIPETCKRRRRGSEKLTPVRKIIGQKGWGDMSGEDKESATAKEKVRRKVVNSIRKYGKDHAAEYPG